MAEKDPDPLAGENVPPRCHWPVISRHPGMFPEGSFLKRYGVPLLVGGFIAVLLRFIINNIKELRASAAARRDKS